MSSSTTRGGLGPQGPMGSKGDTGSKGATGPHGDSGISSTSYWQLNPSSNTLSPINNYSITGIYRL